MPSFHARKQRRKGIKQTVIRALTDHMHHLSNAKRVTVTKLMEKEE
jgi:hypothetical protein